MTFEPSPRLRTPFGPDIALPPPFRLVTLREVGNAFAHAVQLAATEGAGTLIHVGRFDLVEFAVVLEPEEPLRAARRALYAGMAALGDALAAHAPPEKPMAFTWPDAILIDGGLVGGVRLGWPPDAEEQNAPPWLVLGGMIRAVALGEEPGLHPLATALEQEGFGDLGSGRIVESFARHLMRVFDLWQEQGFAAVASEYLMRLAPETGVRRAIDENGDLLERRLANADAGRRALLPVLAQPSWLDPQTGVPRR